MEPGGQRLLQYEVRADRPSGRAIILQDFELFSQQLIEGRVSLADFLVG